MFMAGFGDCGFAIKKVVRKTNDEKENRGERISSILYIYFLKILSQKTLYLIKF